MRVCACVYRSCSAHTTPAQHQPLHDSTRTHTTLSHTSSPNYRSRCWRTRQRKRVTGQQTLTSQVRSVVSSSSSGGGGVTHTHSHASMTTQVSWCPTRMPPELTHAAAITPCTCSELQAFVCQHQAASPQQLSQQLPLCCYADIFLCAVLPLPSSLTLLPPPFTLTLTTTTHTLLFSATTTTNHQQALQTAVSRVVRFLLFKHHEKPGVPVKRQDILDNITVSDR